MEVQAEFNFDFDGDVQVVYDSLLPELDESHHRTLAHIEVIGCSLVLKVRSDDLVSMRAALNGWMRLIKIAFEMHRTIER